MTPPFQYFPALPHPSLPLLLGGAAGQAGQHDRCGRRERVFRRQGTQDYYEKGREDKMVVQWTTIFSSNVLGLIFHSIPTFALQCDKYIFNQTLLLKASILSKQCNQVCPRIICCFSFFVCSSIAFYIRYCCQCAS